MSKRSLVIGMGIGQLYKTVLNNLGHDVITVDMDPSKQADFVSVQDAIRKYSIFDTAHICTPNFTHKRIAEEVSPYTKIVFIEKPGFKTSEEWINMVKTRPFTRFMMVKNNMWRTNIAELHELATKSKTVNFNWINKDRVPSPGTWFTTKDLAFGGVSRDLMPHLLSLYIALNPEWRREPVNGASTQMQWELKDLLTTDYGTVNPAGTYDVDDSCHFSFGNKWNLVAKWRDMKHDDRCIQFIMQNNSEIVFELGLCPEDAYQAMIKDSIEQVDNHKFWLNQYEIDTWIHERIEHL